MARSYKQFYCPIAHALDVVGERWSLLVVRELSHGPLRYTDLLERLDGCGTNVLANRLRELEAQGVVTRRKLPPPAASTVYELTGAGAGLRPVLQALCTWGLQVLGPPGPDARLEPGWLEQALRSLAACAPPTLRVTVTCAGETASIAGGDARAGDLPDAQAVLHAEPAGLYALLVDGDRSAVTVDGDDGVLDELAALFAAPPLRGAPAPV